VKGTSGLIHDAAIEAVGILADVAQSMKTEQLGDRAVLARYARQRGNPQAIVAFAAQQLPSTTPDQVGAEAARYTKTMEDLWHKTYGGD